MNISGQIAAYVHEQTRLGRWTTKPSFFPSDTKSSIEITRRCRGRWCNNTWKRLECFDLIPSAKRILEKSDEHEQKQKQSWLSPTCFSTICLACHMQQWLQQPTKANSLQNLYIALDWHLGVAWPSGFDAELVMAQWLKQKNACGACDLPLAKGFLFNPQVPEATSFSEWLPFAWDSNLVSTPLVHAVCETQFRLLLNERQRIAEEQLNHVLNQQMTSADEHIWQEWFRNEKQRTTSLAPDTAKAKTKPKLTVKAEAKAEAKATITIKPNV